MTYQLTVLYHQPEDPAAFDAHYESTHAPLANDIPGVRGYTAMAATTAAPMTSRRSPAPQRKRWSSTWPRTPTCLADRCGPHNI